MEELDVLTETIIDSIPEYDRISFTANNSIQFKNKTLDVWSQELSFPVFENDLTLDELEIYNALFIKTSDLIMINLANASASYGLSKLQYARAAIAAKKTILEERKASGARAPGAEVLDNLARSVVIDHYSTYKIAGLIQEFWKIQYDKLKLIDNRLTGMNILRNVESKYAAHG